jgi:hypothetical protein
MFDFLQTGRRAVTARLPVGALLLAVLAMTPAIGRAMEVIPSLGVSKATDTNAGDAKFSAGVALRAPLLPFLKLEGGIMYRQDTFFNDNLKVRMWPVTVSAWLAPFPVVYAGGGVGWYRTTYDYKTALPAKDWTTSKVGVHLGGGVCLPIAPKLALDLNGRYVFMQQNNDIDLPSSFNPDFWNASAGLAIQF